jgi:peroxiredoxin
MRTTFSLILLASLFYAGNQNPRAQEKSPTPDSPLSDAEEIWNQVQLGLQNLQPPGDWRGRQPAPDEIAKFQKHIAEAAMALGRQAQFFARRFPTNDNAKEARILSVYAMSHAVAAGDTNAAPEIQTYVDKVLADKNLPEDDRVGVLLYAGNVAFMQKVGMRLFTEGLAKLDAEFEANSLEATRSALKRFPTNAFVYTMLTAMAERAPAERKVQIAQEIVEAPGAPAGVKALAGHMLKGTKPYEIGQPLDIRFKALDGREVDLAKLKGRVVLVEFWSTTCGPCIGEMPGVKAAYEKLHSRGFEIVGISLDDKEKDLRRYLEEKALPWPQHFDGRGFSNEFAIKYGVFGIPTMWLVDRQGRLRFTQVGGQLEPVIERLLGEPADIGTK